MYRLTDIDLQNKQDQFSSMYLSISRNIMKQCGEHKGEGIIREALRNAGAQSGTQRLELLRSLGLRTNLHNFYHCGCTLLDDPRMRTKTIFDEEDRQNWEVHTCPFANFAKNHCEGEIAKFYCEEYQYAMLLAYTENLGQLNLSKNLTNKRDTFCCFSVYFREANLSPNRGDEAFHKKPQNTAPEAAVTLDESIKTLTLTIYTHLLSTARKHCGDAGVCAVADGLKQWAEEAICALKLQAANTRNPFSKKFAAQNFPLSFVTEDDSWKQYNDEQALMLVKTLVLNSITAATEM